MPTEIFRFGIHSFDVDLAAKLIQYGLVEASIQTIDPVSITDALGVKVKLDAPLSNATQSMYFLLRINWDHAAALSQEQLNKPGIMVAAKLSRGQVSSLLIDGNHRMVRHIYDGKKSFSFHYISETSAPMVTFGTARYRKALEKVRKHEIKLAKK